jgi:antitoxin (DNA-binding transcriptional repressor) of toxin-antitoxin stability system
MADALERIFEMEQIQLSQLQENVRAIIVAMRLSDRSVLISDKGKPIAKIVPVPSNEQSWLGCMKDTGKIIGDIMSPAESMEAWEVLAQ